MVTKHEIQQKYAGRRIGVTGGAGFIGSHLCDALVAGGAEVRVLDDFSTGRSSNLAAIMDQVTVIEGSILDSSAVDEAIRGTDTVFHLAAAASVPRSVEEPRRFFDVDAQGTQIVLEAARCAGARRVVYSASSSAYGNQPGLPRVESMCPDPQSPYAAAKCAGELVARAYAATYGLETVSLRYFNIFGPRQRFDSPYAAVVPRFAEALLTGGRPIVEDDGHQTRDFTYVENAVLANLLSGSGDRPLRGEVINVACGVRTSILELLELMAEIVGVEPAYTSMPPRVGDVRDSLASIEAARALVGYEPAVPLREGLARTIEHYRTLVQGGDEVGS